MVAIHFLILLSKAIGLNLLIMTISVGIGWWYQKKLKINFDSPLFNLGFSAAAGLFILVCIYAITKTNFKSEYTFALFALVLPLVYKIFIKNNNTLNSQPEPESFLKTNYVLVAIGAILVATSWQTTIAYSFQLGKICPPSFDCVYYANVSKYIGINGYESTYHYGQLYSKNYSGFVPYHYFELWLADLFSQFIKESHFTSLTINANALLISIIQLLLLGILRTKNWFVNVLTLLLICPTTYFSFDLFNSKPISEYLSCFHDFNPINSTGQKFIPWILVLIIAYYSWIKGKLLNAVYTISFLVFISITSLFSLLGIYLFVSIYLFSKNNKTFTIKQFVFSLLPFATFMLFNYVATKPNLNVQITPNIRGEIVQSFYHLKLISHIIGKSIIQYLIVFGLFFFLTFHCYKLKTKEFKSKLLNINSPNHCDSSPIILCTAILISMIVSLIGYAILHNFIDSEQFFYSICILTSTLFVVIAFSLRKNGQSILFSIILIISTINLPITLISWREKVRHFEKSEVRNFQSIIASISETRNFKVANLNEPKRYQTTFSLSTFCNIPLELITPGNEDNTQIIDLTIDRAIPRLDSLNSPYSKENSCSLIKSSIWVNYLEQNKQNEEILLNKNSNSQLKWKFIKAYNIHYLYLTDLNDTANCPFTLVQLGTFQLNNRKLLYLKY